MKIFAISDLHLSFDEKVDKPMDDFGDGWVNHAARLKQFWDELISDEDLVLIPGDISWGLKLGEAVADLDWIHERPGRKLLVKGNHDLWWTGITKLNAMYDDIIFIQNECFTVEELDLTICGSRGWIMPGSDEFEEHDEKIYRRELGRMRMSLESAARSGASRKIFMTHYPPADDVGRCSEVTQLLEEFKVDFCVYGHLHGAQVWRRGIKGGHNGVEYRLVSLDYLGAKPKLIYEGDSELWTC